MSYRYYSSQRPVMPGSFPKPVGNRVLEIVNFDERKYCDEILRSAWGYIEYENPLDEDEARRYELIAKLSKIRPFNEWTEYFSDQVIAFYTDADSNIHKAAMWQLISDTEMHYTAYNHDGSVNRHDVHKGDDILENWKRYFVKKELEG